MKWIIIAVVAVLLIVSAVLAFVLMGGDDTESDANAQDSDSSENATFTKLDASNEVMYLNEEPPFDDFLNQEFAFVYEPVSGTLPDNKLTLPETCESQNIGVENLKEYGAGFIVSIGFLKDNGVDFDTVEDLEAIFAEQDDVETSMKTIAGQEVLMLNEMGELLYRTCDITGGDKYRQAWNGMETYIAVNSDGDDVMIVLTYRDNQKNGSSLDSSAYNESLTVYGVSDLDEQAEYVFGNL